MIEIMSIIRGLIFAGIFVWIWNSVFFMLIITSKGKQPKGKNL